MQVPYIYMAKAKEPSQSSKHDGDMPGSANVEASQDAHEPSSPLPPSPVLPKFEKPTISALKEAIQRLPKEEISSKRSPILKEWLLQRKKERKRI